MKKENSSRTNFTSSPDEMDEFGCAEMAVRLICIVFIAVCAASVNTGCTYNRNAPFIQHNAPFIQTDLNVKANGNTVPVSAVP